MEKQIVEIANEEMSLTLKRGFCCISNREGEKLAEVPLDNILSLIVSAHNAMLSKNIINTITGHDGAIIFCGKDYMPSSITLPYANHWQNGERIRKQIEASLPLQKILWKLLIQRKIANQALILERFCPENNRITRLKQLSKTVKSGDSGNNEAIAAQIYFKALFGNDFIRDRQADDINILLNYTYIVLRACVARAITGAGLLPALGIIHTNKLNPFTLVDDLIEPYRPLADAIVFDVLSNINVEDGVALTPEIKRMLTRITVVNLENPKGCRSLSDSLFNTANSLARSYLNKKNLLEIDEYIMDGELLR